MQHAAVTVSATPVSGARPDGFLGLALTYRELPRWFPARAPADHVLPALIRNLTPVGRPSLRIGGESADRSWWPIKGHRRPLGIVYDLGPAWVAAALRLAHATNPWLLMGLELEADQPQIDAVEAGQLLRRIGRRYIQSLQIGNEPDLYTTIPWYKLHEGKPVPWFSKVGKPVYARAQPYTPQEFAAEVAADPARDPEVRDQRAGDRHRLLDAVLQHVPEAGGTGDDPDQPRLRGRCVPQRP